ncbi:nicotinamide riboside transporter PnuC [Rhizosphaericola mali]|uniref:Nicotinamide riboside transporter PnuC n=1 Tax=Rhizosphaericola mali TaxID=2545455 RepID=A0A5P2G1L0_9BACT|nr:nicotinamide riboside transporter PnuC [Rhizosphaericola mali]QES87722.1 nicotinamide mononucleotide transporter [Rhizosphaericola mali]
MNLQTIYEQFMNGVKMTTPLEFIAVITGIASTYFSKKEKIYVFPTGIVSTLIYIFISFKGKLFAEAGLNIYYTIMSISGWYLWTNKSFNDTQKPLLISYNRNKDWRNTILYFVIMWIALYFILHKFTSSTVPFFDALASSSAYTAMFLMNRKKVESWYFWILTDIISMPLYFSKGYVFTSVQFLVFLLISISGWISWHKTYTFNQVYKLNASIDQI